MTDLPSTLNQETRIHAAYRSLLRLPHTHPFRALNQDIYARLRDAIAKDEDADSETIQFREEAACSEMLLPSDNDLLIRMTEAFRRSVAWQNQSKDVAIEPAEAVAKSMRMVLAELRPYLKRELVAIPDKYAGATEPPEKCAANRDGDCTHPFCPQNLEGEPMKSGRHCPLDTWEDLI